ncbi:fibronectin type III domain-containing protein, partial [Pseudomonas silesiensis]|uniref:fibronectin type III domain-containing protein n=1 Tax=Pseudomonas silesiensis TaxID=1853130 RepID=UPI0034D3A948
DRCDPTSVSLAWDAPTGGTAVDVYHINSFDAPTVTVDSTVLTYTVRGLTPSKTYQHLVGARDKDSELSGPSNIVHASTSAALPEWKTNTDYVKGDKVMYAGAS